MAFQIHAFAKKESNGSSFRISDIPVAAFGSRAHLEEKALATVKYFFTPNNCYYYCPLYIFLSFIWFFINIIDVDILTNTRIYIYYIYDVIILNLKRIV